MSSTDLAYRFNDGDAYDRYMGIWSRAACPAFLAWLDAPANAHWLDVGCGTGVLTEELARRLGAENVAGADPSPMLEATAERVPGIELRQASAEELPWPDDGFDATLSQLVMHFLTDPAAGVDEMARVTRPGGVVASCTWDFAGGGMQLLGTFWQSARAIDPEAESESSTMGDRQNLEALWRDCGLQDVETRALEVSSRYEDFEELWSSFSRGVGPAGQHLQSLPPDRQAALKEQYFARIGEPRGSFELGARSWAVRGRVPS